MIILIYYLYGPLNGVQGGGLKLGILKDTNEANSQHYSNFFPYYGT